MHESGSCFFQISDTNVHYARTILDEIFGKENFVSSIIFQKIYYRGSNYLDNVNDIILWYAKDPDNFTFRYDDIDRIPYMAPGLVGPEKANKGNTPTDSWWQTIVSPNGKEKTGYPTQKPLVILLILTLGLSRYSRLHHGPSIPNSVGESCVCRR